MTTLGLLGQCCGPCWSTSLAFEARTLYVQVAWCGVQIGNFSGFNNLPDDFDPSTAYLKSVEVTAYPDLTSTLGPDWTAQTQTITQIWSKYTGEMTTSHTTWSTTQANFNGRAALGPDGVSSSTAALTNTVYEVDYINPTTMEVFWTDTVTLSEPNTVAEVNAACAALFDSYSTSAIAWNQTLVISLDVDGNPVETIGGNGGGTGMLGANIPVDVSDYPSEPYSQPYAGTYGSPGTPGTSSYAVLAAGDAYTDMGFWTYLLGAYDPTVSDCAYECLSSGSPMTLYRYDTPPSAPYTMVWLAYNTSYVPNTVPSPCDSSGPPTC